MAYLVICFFCGLAAGIIGRWKHSSFFIWFLIGAVLPLLGIVAALLWRYEDNEPYRACEECGNVVPLYQQVCSHCGADLEWPSEESLLVGGSQ
jgi:predicted nucleic acid-binding Zn ribbon protein